MRNKDSAGYRGTLHDSPNRCCVLSFIYAVNIAQKLNTTKWKDMLLIKRPLIMGVQANTTSKIAESHLKCNFAFLQSFLNYLKPMLYASKMCSKCPAIN